MSVLKVEYLISEEARRQAVVNTGNRPPEFHKIEIDMAGLTAEQRETILTVWAFGNQDHIYIDLRRQFTGVSTLTPYRDDKQNPEKWLSSQSYCYPRIMDSKQIMTAITAFLDKRGRLLEQVAPQVAAAVAEAEAQAAEHTRLLAASEAIFAQAEQVSDDEEALSKIRDEMPDDMRNFKKGYRDDGVLSRFYGRFLKPFNEAREEAQKAEAKAEKAAWIETHGSEHLKLAVKGGHEVGRIYTLERAAIAYPGWVVDYQGKSDWNDRNNPTLTELKAAEEAEKQLGQNVKLVWLTAPPQENPDHVRDDWDYDGYDFIQKAALVTQFMNHYRGKNLIKTL